MRLLHVINAVYSQPWLILPSYHANIRRVVQTHLLDRNAGPREGEDFSGNAVELPGMVIEDGIAQIPVPGVIIKGATKFEKGAGAVSTEDITADIKQAMEDDTVNGIFLDIDSPGGTVGGVPELGRLVADAKAIKPVRAFTDGMCCSAAYWMAAGASDIIASESADVGSIGVYLPWIDDTEAFAMEGLTVEIIRNEGADLKGLGFPGTSLTQEQRDYLQSDINDTALAFHQHINNHRAVNESSDTFRGQSFMAKRALERGLLDNVMDRESALADFAELV